MEVFPEDYIRSVVGKAALAFNFTEWEYSLQKLGSIGQNYFGVLIPVTLIGKTNGEGVNVALVLKLAPTDERYRVSGAVTLMFAREVFVYSTLLQHYRAQQQTLTLPRYVVPASYYVCGDYCREAIVLEDMTNNGYRPYTHSMFLDVNHVTEALKSLAIFHANSFILKIRNFEQYDEASNVCVPLTKKTNQRFMQVMEDRLNKAIQKFDNTNYGSLFETLKQSHVKYVEATYTSVSKTCICHGDIWKENILFKYEGDTPTFACLIDYQTARLSSPAYDVLYLITSSTDTELRQQYFHDLLDIYYTQFEKVLHCAGLQSQEIYSRKLFDKDLQTVAPACVIVANTALWLASGLQQEGHVRSKRVLVTDEDKAAAAENYKQIMRGIIDDFLSYEYLCMCYQNNETMFV
ncbi:uncharacterized protein LOC126379876 [Pectinophora gossypiella]|uniref:uncharacterized protein LOC126379876 n=1 Tax=Pectinophora gossypiella TaxID=13191 RepID=UPI00214DF1A6|nr:uncharacterized protein LOC126379876 [Pectinophora gossypiella]